VGKNFHTFFLCIIYKVSHTIFVFLIHARPFITTWKNCNVSMQCIFMLFFMLWPMHAVRERCTHTQTFPLFLFSHTSKSRSFAHEKLTRSCKTIFIHIWIFQFSSVFRPKRFFYFSVFIILRGSNNKHLLLKCINCNKNNNKLKQLLQRRAKKKHSVITEKKN
jgi:hypothetical protein